MGWFLYMKLPMYISPAITSGFRMLSVNACTLSGTSAMMMMMMMTMMMMMMMMMMIVMMTVPILIIMNDPNDDTPNMSFLITNIIRSRVWPSSYRSSSSSSRLLS